MMIILLLFTTNLVQKSLLNTFVSIRKNNWRVVEDFNLLDLSFCNKETYFQNFFPRVLVMENLTMSRVSSKAAEMIAPSTLISSSIVRPPLLRAVDELMDGCFRSKTPDTLHILRVPVEFPEIRRPCLLTKMSKK